MRRLAGALKDNTKLEKLEMANTRATDRMAKVLYRQYTAKLFNIGVCLSSLAN